MFSISLKAQSANDLYDQAVAQYNDQQYTEAKKTIKAGIALAKVENWDKENWIEILRTNCVIEERLDINQAVIDYLQLLEICENSLGIEHSAYGTILYNLAGAYSRMGDFDKALSFYKNALENAEKSLGTEDPEYVNRLYNLAVAYSNKSEFGKALTLYQNALEKTKKSLGENNDAYRNILTGLGRSYFGMGEYSKALPFFNRALQNGERNLGKDHSYYGVLLNDLALSYYYLGDYKTSLSLFFEARENTEKSLGKDHYQYGDILSGLSGLYTNLADYDNALPLALEVLEITEKSIGTNHPNYGVSLNNLAVIYEKMGDYAKAFPLFLKSLEQVERTLGKEHLSYGAQLSNIAGLYFSMGENDKAITMWQEALKNTEMSLGKNSAVYGGRLNDLGLVYQKIGEYDKALPLYKEALVNTEKTLGKNHPEYIALLNNVAILYQETGKFDQSLALYLEGLKSVEKTLGKNHLFYGNYLNNLANLYKEMGEYDKALPLQLEALRITEKSLGKENSEYANRLNNLGGLYKRRSEYEKSLSIYLKGIESNKKNLANNIFGLTEESKASLIKQNFYNTDILQSLLLQLPDTDPNNVVKAWEHILFYKGLGLKSANLLKQKLQSSKDPEILLTVEQFELYQNLVNKELAKPIINQNPLLSEYQAKAKVAETHLLEKSQDFKELKEGLFASYKDIAKSLKEGEVAIDFTHFNFHREKETDTVYYAAYIIKRELTTPKMVLLFTEKELLEIADVSTSNPSAINTNYLKRGAEPINNEFSNTNLYDLVWEKLIPHLKDIKTVYLSPTGHLSKVSFAAMQDRTGQYLGEKYQINYMLSLTDLLFEKTDTTPTSFLLAGGINYDYKATNKEAIKDTFDFSASARRGLRGNTWTYLEGTKIESQKIESLLKAAKKETFYFSEEKATEKNIKSALTKSPSVFHIATHGFYIPMETKREEINFHTENVYKANEDPMYRSGLLLAGGNYAWENGGNPYEEEDGILLAKEISTMNLSKTQLVVLSACETGLGDVNGSEGVMGLQRALKMAGVQYQITTLWQVPDTETVEFMMLFYEDWIVGSSVEQSFNKAQLTMSKKYAADPFKWGAFVLYQ
ncbi:MAG: CHAT domain-containing tetratricopeptide repeat protein [Aequorivita sp.]